MPIMVDKATGKKSRVEVVMNPFIKKWLSNKIT